MGAIAVVTSVGTEEQANEIARELISRRQAACVNIVTCIRSFYRWKGQVCEDGELLLIIKTEESEFASVQETIMEIHNYELPEILAFDVKLGSLPFLEWISSSIDKAAEFVD